MKSLTIIIHTDDEQELINYLRARSYVGGFTLTHVSGHGVKPEQDAFLAARDQVVGASPRLKVEIIVHDDDAETLLIALRGLKEAEKLHEAYYWITPVQSGGHL